MVPRREDIADRNALILLWLLRRRRRTRKTRNWWVRPINTNRKKQGDYYNLIPEMRLTDHQSYKNFFRMMPNQFDELLRLVGPLLQKSSKREPICPAERLSVTLRYLATGDSMVSLAYAFRLGHPTVSSIISETCAAIWVVLGQQVFRHHSEQNWLQISKDFEEIWNFPNCVGAIDGKHIVMQAQPGEGSGDFNYKGTHSIILLAVCDARYCFTYVDIGAPGRQSDGGVFHNSTFGQSLRSNNLSLPPPKNLPGTSTRMPHVFVADSAFPLMQNMMRPYPGRFLPSEEIIFNYRLSRARRIIENTFGIMAAKWRLFRRPINLIRENVKRTTKAIVCLHNWLINQDHESRPSNARRYCIQTDVDHEDAQGNLFEGSWRRQVENVGAIMPLQRVGSNNYTVAAGDIRQKFKEYFCGHGQVPWQWNKVPDEQAHG